MALLAALWPRASGVPRFERLTFRRGTMEAARFAPDGQTLVYGAAWAGAPVELFTGRVGSPEWRALGHTGTELLAISSRGELAVSLRRRRLGTFVGAGTLARLPLAGGAPREVQEDVHEADWAPDGSDLAVVRSVAGQHRLEYPIGKVLYQTAGLGQPRPLLPRGERIAFVDHPVWGDDGGHVAVVDRAGDVRRLSRNWGSAQGLAGTRRAARCGSPRPGRARPGRSTRWTWPAVSVRWRAWPACSRSTTWRRTGACSSPTTWCDGRWPAAPRGPRRSATSPGSTTRYPSDLSSDGATVFFAENGEGGGPGYGAYLRRGDGTAPAVRIGEGAAMALSADGKWALANQDSTTDTPQLVLLPTGAGLAQRLPRGGVNAQAADFFPDGRILITGSEAGKPVRTWVQDRDGAPPRPLTAEGTRFNLATRPITPDGRLMVLRDAEGRWRLFSSADGTEAGPVAGLTPDDQPLRFTASGRQLYTYRPGEVPAKVVRLDPATGERVQWLELQPADRAGVLAVGPVQLTPDGRSYVYGYRRVLSDLYVVSGLR